MKIRGFFGGRMLVFNILHLVIVIVILVVMGFVHFIGSVIRYLFIVSPNNING